MSLESTSKTGGKRPRFLMVRRVVGKSMWPVLDPEQIVVALRRRKYQEEDVIVLWHNGREKIKRIRLIDNGKFDVRGDNPSKSTDSRQFGLIEKGDILGKVIWPRV
ncbi:MAG: nickel-type superoxide dismutase maturation protease [Candidatus Saccharimonadales bacterium]